MENKPCSKRLNKYFVIILHLGKETACAVLCILLGYIKINKQGNTASFIARQVLPSLTYGLLQSNGAIIRLQ